MKDSGAGVTSVMNSTYVVEPLIATLTSFTSWACILDSSYTNCLLKQSWLCIKCFKNTYNLMKIWLTDSNNLWNKFALVVKQFSAVVVYREAEAVMHQNCLKICQLTGTHCGQQVTNCTAHDFFFPGAICLGVRLAPWLRLAMTYFVFVYLTLPVMALISVCDCESLMHLGVQLHR